MSSKRSIIKTLKNGIVRVWQSLISPHPSIQEISERRRAQLLSTISLITTAFLAWGIFSRPTSYGTFLVLFGIALISYALSRTRYHRASSYFFSYGLTSLTYLSLAFGNASSFTSVMTSIGHVSIVVASILLPFRGFVILVVLSIAATFMAPFYSQTAVLMESGFFRDAGVFTTIGIILIGANIFRSRLEQERLKEAQNVNRELEDIKNNLERRVDERTTELETANRQALRRAAQLQAITEFSESIAQVQDLDTLLQAATNIISQRFGFYHVGIFLVDSEHEYAVLQSSNSEGGKQMLKRKHRLKLGTGVVGHSARTGSPRIALDVGSDAVYFDNPDLPATRSEAALPLKSLGQTVGVLDVQSTDAGAFSSEDLQVLTTLANQVSIALVNARLLTETRTALSQAEAVYNEYTRTEWSRAVTKAEQAGFRYQTGRIEMLESALSSPEVLSAVESGMIVQNQTNGSEEKRATMAVPVKLRGEIIGILHVESSDPSRIWRTDELSLVEAVAERAAFALENARLFQDARRRAAKERLISEATSKISGALNLENILQITAQELERVLGGSDVSIRLQNKDVAKESSE